jgi:2,4-diketo-3-deoxy-L-fuconate hydrolase
MTDTSSFALGTFSEAGGPAFTGLLTDGLVLPLRNLGVVGPETMLTVLEEWERNFDVLREICADASAARRSAISVAGLRVHAPVPRPGTVYCSGANYRKHVVDLIVAHQEPTETRGMTVEEKRAWGMKLMDERARTGTPFIFVKPQSSVTGPFDPILIPHEARKPDWELELAVVMGRRARRVTRDHALDFVAGYTIVDDITLREKVFRRKVDSPELGMDFTISKGAPSFLPMGPYMVPAEFVGDPQRLRLTLKLNGQVMQDEEAADMIFTVAHLIEYLSSSVELQPGDIICTGSPAGNGMLYNRFIQDGDVLEGTIASKTIDLGTQRNPCVLEKP